MDDSDILDLYWDGFDPIEISHLLHVSEDYVLDVLEHNFSCSE